MKIAIDLEGTLIAECGEFSCERTSYLAQLLFARGIRLGACPLLRDLARAGHRITLYSVSEASAVKLTLWCWLAGLPVSRVVTLAQEKKRALRQTKKNQKRFSQDLKALGLTHFGKSNPVIWPPCQGQDLLLDDDSRRIQAAWRSGVKGVLVTNYESDWTARIREAALQSHEIDVLAQTQAA
jgi:hypothetical protein